MLTDQELLTFAANHQRAGQASEAENIYRQLLARHPRNAGLLNEIGVLAYRGGRLAEARECFEQAIALDPENPSYFNNHGSVLQSLGEFEAALGSYEQAVRLDPALVIVHYNIGYAWLSLGQWDAAIAHFQRVLVQMPDHADSHLNLGHALARKGETDRAIAVYRAALERLPNYAPLWNNLGNALKVKADWDGAIAAYRGALRLDQSDALAANNLGDASLEFGLVDEAVALFRHSIASRPSLVEAHSNLIFALHLHPDATMEGIAEECGRWWRQHGAPLRVAPEVVSDDCGPDRRLRVGYVSPDLREHPVGRHLLPVLRAHDTAQFEIVVYSDAPNPDDMTAQFREYAALWRDSRGWSDEQLAAEIRRDRVDILLDLSQHSAGNRLRVFARQPAPVQISFAGYPGSTGLETIGWRITDRFLDPPEGERPTREELVRLPDSFWCFDPSFDEPSANVLPAPGSRATVFGCLSKFCKVNSRVIGWWSEILHQVSDSRLLLLCPAGGTRDRVMAAFGQAGIESERVLFTDRVSRPEYLALYHQIAIALDPFPYNGHMTTCDALWMGVPVVSLAGRTPVSRGGLSLLSNVGLPELVAFTPAEYVRIAVELARDDPRLTALRAGLPERMQSSALMDTVRFTHSLEVAYRSIWRHWCAARTSKVSSEALR